MRFSSELSNFANRSENWKVPYYAENYASIFGKWLLTTRITDILVLPLFYQNYAQDLILCHIMLIFPKPANYAENYASLIRQSLSYIYIIVPCEWYMCAKEPTALVLLRNTTVVWMNTTPACSRAGYRAIRIRKAIIILLCWRASGPQVRYYVSHIYIYNTLQPQYRRWSSCQPLCLIAPWPHGLGWHSVRWASAL